MGREIRDIKNLCDVCGGPLIFGEDQRFFTVVYPSGAKLYACKNCCTEYVRTTDSPEEDPSVVLIGSKTSASSKSVKNEDSNFNETSVASAPNSEEEKRSGVSVVPDQDKSVKNEDLNFKETSTAESTPVEDKIEEPQTVETLEQTEVKNEEPVKEIKHEPPVQETPKKYIPPVNKDVIKKREEEERKKAADNFWSNLGL